MFQLPLGDCGHLIDPYSQPVIVRHAAITCLRKTLNSAGRSVSDQNAKDITKSLRNLLGDKSLALQRAAATVSRLVI
jgi:hypothetical protein